MLALVMTKERADAMAKPSILPLVCARNLNARELAITNLPPTARAIIDDEDNGPDLLGVFGGTGSRSGPCSV